MADSTVKPDDTNDLVLQNNHGASKIEVNEDDTIVVTSGGDATIDATGDIILDAGGADITLKDGGTTFGTLKQVSGDLVIQPTTSKQIVLNEDGGAEALVIDTSGYITKSKQPGFYAYGGAGIVAIANNNYVILTNDSTLPAFDTASNYDTGTGQFTTPIAGKYIFGFSCYATSAAEYAWTITDGTTTYARMFFTSANANMDWGFSTVCNVEASKAIGVRNEQGASKNIYQSAPVHSRFWGYLLG